MNKIERVRASASHMIKWIKEPHGSISNKVLVKDAEDALSLCDDLEIALAALEEIAEWPRFPKGPNFSIKHLAQTALKEIDES